MPYKSGKKWKAQVRKEGLRQEKTFDTKKEAIDWETKMRKKPADEWVEKTDTVCLADWAQQYLDYAEAKFSEKTYKEKKAMFKLFFKQVVPELPVGKLTSKTVLNYVLEQRKQRSGYAANKDRKNLVAAWHWGVKYMDPPLPLPNPCQIDKMPEKRQPRYVPPEEDFWKIYQVAEGQDKVMLLAFLHLAARRGEIFRLTWGDVDFFNSRVRLKTCKRMGGTLEHDWLPMTTELREALRGWWVNRPVKESPYVFICLDKTQKKHEHYGKPFTHRHQFMKQICKTANVEHFGFHAIRHLTASILYNRGYEVAIIQLILRHKSPSTTEGYLKTLGLEKARDALENLSMKNGKVLNFPAGEQDAQAGS
ncbi:MAG: tyrosine-type recombinase/integrase [Desulfobacterales bacterium]